MTTVLRAVRANAANGTPILELRTNGGDVVVVASLHNPLEGSGRHGRSESHPAALLAMWSGWLDAQSDIETGAFEPSLATWTRPGQEAFVEWLTSQLRAHNDSSPLLLRPHARHVLSDPQRVLSSFRDRSSSPVRLLLEPTAFLTPEMIDDADDHLRRAFEALLPQRWTWGTLLTGATTLETDWGREVVPCPITHGRISAGTLIGLLHDGQEPSKPIILLDEEFDEQHALLEESGLLAPTRADA